MKAIVLILTWAIWLITSYALLEHLSALGDTKGVALFLVMLGFMLATDLLQKAIVKNLEGK